jgi:hypothetical protein
MSEQVGNRLKAAHRLEASAAKSRLIAQTSLIIAEEGLRRHEAFREACRRDPQVRKDLVVTHNIKHGRAQQAAKFAAEFDGVAEKLPGGGAAGSAHRPRAGDAGAEFYRRSYL